MSEIPDPNYKGFKDKFFGLIKSKYKKGLYKRYEFCNNYTSNKIVLDVPSGMGWGTSLLKGYKEVYGLEKCEEAVEYAKSHYPGNYTAGNMTDIPYDENFFDLVICLEGFEHITFLEGQKFIQQVKRILKKDGKMIMTVPLLNNRRTSRNPFHLCEYYEPELKDILEREFEIKHYEKIQGPDCPIARCVLVNKK